MTCLFNFHYLKVQMVENCASVNVAETVLNLPHCYTKTNQGYGDNVGDGQIIPSSGVTIDPDLLDAPGWLPRYQPEIEVKP